MLESANQKIDELTVDEKLGLTVDTNSTNASAISVITPSTGIVTAGAETRTLPNGREGQIKTIFCKTYVGDCVITPASMGGAYTTITLGAAGRGCTLQYCNGEWHVIGLGGATIA